MMVGSLGLRAFAYRNKMGAQVPYKNNCADALTVVVCLLIVQAVSGGALTVSLVCLSLLAFSVAVPVLSQSDRRLHWHPLTPMSTLLEACCDVLARWGVIVAVLLVIFYVFALPTYLSRKVILTWIVTTPVVLCLSRAERLRTR